MIIIEYWFIWIIFGEKIAKTAFFAISGKNRYFLKKNALPRTRRGGVKFFCEKKIFWCIKSTYKQVSGWNNQKCPFFYIQTSHRDPKIESFEANSPYKLIQNAKNTKIALKSRKINIFLWNKKLSSWFFVLFKIIII